MKRNFPFKRQGVSCGASANSAVTHTSSVNKTAPVALVWTPPPPPSLSPMAGSTAAGGGSGGSGGQVIFVATVVQSFDTYWVGIYSDAVDLPMAVATTPSTRAMTGSVGVTPATANLGFVGASGNGTANKSELLFPITQ